MVGVKHAYACSSGTAAIHCAIAALDPEPGDEIITTPITDMGALAPILYQGAIPVFADVDPLTCNVTAATIEARISERTKAIVVTHLFGNPCDIDEIVALGAAPRHPGHRRLRAGVPRRVQGQLRRHRRARSAASAFSRASTSRPARAGWSSPNDDAARRRMYLFINKAWGYGDPQARPLLPRAQLPHVRAAAAASRCAQLEKLPKVVAPAPHARRNPHREASRGRRRSRRRTFCAGAQHSYWKYCVRIADSLPAGRPSSRWPSF